LILPRSQTLSVRLICSRECRIHRLAGMLDIDASEAEKQLNTIDIEQHKFFKSVYHKAESSPDTFDIISSMDPINGSSQVARIVAKKG